VSGVSHLARTLLAISLLTGAASARSDDATGGAAAPPESDRAAVIQAKIQAHTDAAISLLEQSASFLAAQDKFA
jgi:hypothetical protein